MDKFLKIYQF